MLKSSKFFACDGHLLGHETLDLLSLSHRPVPKQNEVWHWYWPLLPNRFQNILRAKILEIFACDRHLYVSRTLNWPWAVLQRALLGHKTYNTYCTSLSSNLNFWIHWKLTLIRTHYMPLLPIRFQDILHAKIIKIFRLRRAFTGSWNFRPFVLKPQACS